MLGQWLEDIPFPVKIKLKKSVSIKEVRNGFPFSKAEQHPKYLDHSLQTRKTIWYFFYKITTVVI